MVLNIDKTPPSWCAMGSRGLLQLYTILKRLYHKQRGTVSVGDDAELLNQQRCVCTLRVVLYYTVRPPRG